MAISNQVDTSIGSHVVSHTSNNAVPTSPNKQRSRSYAAKNQSLFTSKIANITNEDSPPHLKVPVGDGPYVRAKQVQLVERDPERAIALFWAAINAGDRVDSALKDMAVVMKQQNRGEEAIQAILSFRHLCSSLAQESLDNVLLDLYKKCGRLDDQVELLKHKLNLIHKGMVFNGKLTKTARSQGKKFQISIRQEATRLLVNVWETWMLINACKTTMRQDRAAPLQFEKKQTRVHLFRGNLGWSYMQLGNYVAAEAVYRKALSIDADNNKLCNLGVCLLKQHKYEEARVVLDRVTPMSPDGSLNSDSHIRSFERSRVLLQELHAAQNKSHIKNEIVLGDTINKTEQSLITPKDFDLWSHWKLWEAPTPNFAADTVEISDNPAEISTNLALNHFKLSSTNDLAMQESYDTSKEIVGAYRTDDLLADGILTGTIAPATQQHTGSFKREIGPSSTLQQSKAKKNTHANDNINGSSCKFAADNCINTVDACWLNDGWVSPAMSCQAPVARRLLLDGIMQEVQSDKESISCLRAIGNASHELMDASSCAREAFNVIDEDFRLNPCMMDTSFNDGAREDAMDVANLDFTCVDRVIESIVPDAPSASQAILNISMSNGKENNASSNACALDNARYDQDEFCVSSRGAHAEHVESMEVHQHRLRIFQEMTHVAPSCALEI